MSAHSFDDLEITYDNAELVPATGVTAAQWARAEALKAILGAGQRHAGDAGGAAIMVGAYAELIITGSLPEPPPGVRW